MKSINLPINKPLEDCLESRGRISGEGRKGKALCAELECWSADRQYGLRISQCAWRRIERSCRLAGRMETGGILVGTYSNDSSCATVTAASPCPADSKRTARHFCRG